MWRRVDNGTGEICTRFAVCNGTDAYQKALQAEADAHGDILFLPCEEGYGEGLLTKKVIATLKAYGEAKKNNDTCMDRAYLMKVDDDTFVTGRRFREGVTAIANAYGEELYAGVPFKTFIPIRNSSSKWYEPSDVFPDSTYPRGMLGGPGYILGKPVIQRIIDQGLADQHVLWSEDRAVSVWVAMLRKSGVRIQYVTIPGINGYYQPLHTGIWSLYPHILTHNVCKNTIRCLMELDRINNPEARVDRCFLMQPRSAFDVALDPSTGGWLNGWFLKWWLWVQAQVVNSSGGEP
jgi:hypothetical protein